MGEMSDSGIYRGRLMCDGQGNLLADESKRVTSRYVQVFDENGNPVLDGEGNELTMLVDLFRYGNNHGRPVAMHEGSYIFVNAGEASHNERHHKQFVTVDGTVDKSMTDDPSLVNADEKKNQHHFSVPEGDPHYDADTDNNTRLRFAPDKVAATETSHTDAYEGKHEVGGDK